MKFNLKCVIMVCCTWQLLFSQDLQPSNQYELILIQVEIYRDILEFSEEWNRLYFEAESLYASGQPVMAEIYLSEILEKINLDSRQEKNTGDLNYFIFTGLDFNRQEFEGGYSQDDSTVLDELSKPYAGFKLEFRKPGFGYISNSFRYDKENIRNDFGLQFHSAEEWLWNYNSYLNFGTNQSASSYWDNRIGMEYEETYSGKLPFRIRNDAYYKRYFKSLYNAKDYLRNRFETGIELDFSGRIWYANFIYEINQVFRTRENDYVNYQAGINYLSNQSGMIDHSGSLDCSYRDYAFALNDSIYSNSFYLITNNFRLEFNFTQKFKLLLENELHYKVYRTQSDIETNYWYDFFQPSLLFSVTNNLETGLGYNYEIKNHFNTNDQSDLIREQNYQAHGPEISVNYIDESGVFISLSGNYLQRRYQESVTNSLINLYSNSNIFSLMGFVFVPITKNIALNAFGTYDNDKDIDQSDISMQSTIFGVELQLKY